MGAASPFSRPLARSAAGLLAGLAVGLMAGLVAVIATVEPAGAVFDDPDVDTSADYTYVVDLEAGEIDVTVELAFTADKPNRSTANGQYQYYFDGTFLAVPAEVGDLRVTDGSDRDLTYEIDESVSGVDQLLIDFRRNVYYRQSTDVVVHFTLPGGPPRGEELTRVNGAYAGFEAWVDPRLEAATVTVITPVGFIDRSTGSDPFERPLGRSADDETELVFEATAIDPEDYWSAVSMTRDASLAMSEIEVGDVDLDIWAWPGDDRWNQFVIDNLEVGLPILIDEVGLPWPIEGDLTIIESFTPYLNGYAGWYDLATDDIEIGDELDTHVMFHELSHVWFNGGLFAERWITEGLADEFGAEVAEAVGEERPTPPPTFHTASVAEPLNRWRVGTDDVELEQWSYGASWTVTRAIADEVGLDVLAQAIQAAADDEIAYLGDGDPEPWARPDDWRRYLDLIENRGSVADDAVTELLIDWVLTDVQAGELEDRATSRARYATLVDDGDDWAPPLAVRTAMAGWSFEDADELMDESSAVLDLRAEISGVLDEAGTSLPDASEVALATDVEQSYEGAEDDLAEVVERSVAALATAEHLRDTGRAIDAATGPLERIGAIGADHRADLSAAADEFSDGDLTAADRGLTDLDETIESLGRRGLIRTLSAVGLLVVGVLAIVWLRRRRRKAGEPSPGSASSPSPSPGEVLRELELESTIGGVGVDVDDRPIPIISLADLDRRRPEITEELWSAATEVGFFQLADHGIPPDLIDRAFAAAEAFFGLPDEVKGRHPWRRELNAGWETRSQVRPSVGVVDQKESYQVTRPNMGGDQPGEAGGLWPADEVLPDFRTTMETIEDASWRVAMEVLSCFADRLGFDREFFARAHDPAGEGYQSTVRLLHYFPMTGDEFEGGRWRAGAHTDYDCLTLLFQREGQSGLQVCPGQDAASGRWTSVTTDEGLITCNIGDMLMRWSDDQLRSTLHRVRGPASGVSAPSRYSMAFFAQANKPALIESPSGAFEPITASDFLQQRIAANFAR